MKICGLRHAPTGTTVHGSYRYQYQHYWLVAGTTATVLILVLLVKCCHMSHVTALCYTRHGFMLHAHSGCTHLLVPGASQPQASHIIPLESESQPRFVQQCHISTSREFSELYFLKTPHLWDILGHLAEGAECAKAAGAAEFVSKAG